MLFNTPEYFLLFLPVSIIVYFFFSKRRYFAASKLWLLLCSLFFYCYWKFDYIWILLGSIVFNFVIGSILSKEANADEDATKLGVKDNQNSDERTLKNRVCSTKRKLILIFGVLANVALLGYYKYTDFLISDLNLLLGTSYELVHIVLPLAISFFTFQQIAYLVDSYKGLTKEYDFVSYAVFVSFFPQLIAGPIVHHKDLIPQFFKARNLFLNYKNLCFGLFIFTIGLIKKAIIADKFAIWVGDGFDSANNLTLLTSWLVSFCYTFQLYFDFSGYCDMAVGSALFFNIKLPINFNSPYKALSIQDFWRRWHITLSSFLRDYLYFPLGGSRQGSFRTYVNLFIVFFITGIWHGAGNTFVLWGLLHGVAIIIHRVFHNFSYSLPRVPAWILTFIFVDIAWVLFRAPDLNVAYEVYSHMFDFGSLSLEQLSTFKSALKGIGLNYQTITYVVLALIVVLTCKNSNELLAKVATIKNERLSKLYTHKEGKLQHVLYKVGGYCACVFVALILFYVTLAVIGSSYTEFIYFNF
jgi:D-alanyl-lipoteichoic acid acyltransferase DltB (MBOAT superfamily)